MTPAKRLIMMGGRRYKNILHNGNFVLDSDSDGLADGWNQSRELSEDFYISDGVQYWTALSTYFAGGINQNIIAQSNHVYYGYLISQNIRYIHWESAGGYEEIVMNVAGQTSYSKIFTYTGSYENVQTRTYAYATGECAVDDFIIVDLTAEFGAGNEPTLEWCDANIPQNIIW